MNRKKIVRTAIILVVLIALVVVFLRYQNQKNRPEWRTDGPSEGLIREVVTSTGSLNPTVLVEVGTEVSGKIEEYYKDFNDRVRKGELIAKLDTELLQTALLGAESDLEKARTTLEETRLDYNIQVELFAKDMTTEYEKNKAKFKLDQAVLAEQNAQLSMQRAQTNLQNAYIRSPIDGIIVSREIEAGQTVAASMNSPTLFKIANNLNQMQITAAIDEADIGKIHVGLPVEFAVDAYPNESFNGSVQQIRLNPNTDQNVVSYDVIINAANPEGKLLPGMTTSVTIVVQSKPNVMRIPETATRFRPSKEIWEQMGLEWDEDIINSARRNRPTQSPPTASQNKATADSSTNAQAASSRSADPRGRRPDQVSSSRPAGAEVSQFNPAGSASSRARFAMVWVLKDGKPSPQFIRTGISDGAFVEVIDGLEPGTVLVTGINYRDAKQAAAASAVNPATSGPGMGRRF